MDLYNIYRKLFTSTTNESVCWWYLGTAMSNENGLGPIPKLQAETLMVFRTETPAPDTLKIRWQEIGYFRNITTGEIADSWFNPYTGKSESRAKSFVDGPAEYTITRQGEGVAIKLIQNHALIDSVTLVSSVANGQIALIQTEDKKRIHPRADGSWPDVNGPEANKIRTTLSMYGNLAEAQDPRTTNVRASGYYTSGRIEEIHTGNYITGIMQKAAPDEILNPIAWQRLKLLYPNFFQGDCVSPSWD